LISKNQIRTIPTIVPRRIIAEIFIYHIRCIL